MAPPDRVTDYWAGAERLAGLEEVFGEVLLLGARLWLAGLLRRVGPTPLVCLPISGAQWRQRNLAPPENQPRVRTAPQVRPTCSCAEAGFLYSVFYRHPASDQKNAPWGVSLSHPWHWDATHPSCKPGEAEVLRRGAAEPLRGQCFLWIPVVLISLLLSFQLVPLLPPLLAVGQ